MKRVSEKSPDHAAGDGLGDISEALWKSMVTSLREIRIARRISLRELSKTIGVHSTHLARVEKGATLPNVVFVIQWSLALRIDFARLYHVTRVGGGNDDAEIG